MKLKTNKPFWREMFITTIFVLAIEIIFRVIVCYSLISWSTLRIILSSFLFVLGWNFIFSFTKSIRKQRIANAFLILIITVYGMAQAGFLNFLGIYMSFGTTSQIGAVTSYVMEFLHSLRIEYYLILFPFIIYILYLVFTWHKKLDVEKISFIRMRLQLITTFLVTACFYYATLIIPFMQNSLQLINNLDLFHNPTNSSIAVNQFGTSMFGFLDLKTSLFPYEDFGIYSDNITNNNNSNSRKFDDTAWQQLQENTSNQIYQNLNNYFMNRPISDKNEYTGYFKDKNVIVIMMESVNTVIENQEYFPNFAKMLEHGWYFKNNYSPRNSCATINNETSGMTSLYTINNVCTANLYQDNTYYESIFNLFKNAGYKTSSYHDYDLHYYARDVIHPNMGSELYVDINTVKMPYSTQYSQWPNDAEFVEKMLPYFIDEEKFFVWFTTVSGHQPYLEDSILGDYYYDLFADTNYDDSVKHFLSKIKFTDDALGVLLSSLEKENKLDDTVIVLYGDHYPYALSEEEINSFMDYETDNKFMKEKTPFLIYNANLEKQVFDKYTSYINLTPTLANLFDLDYDPRLYLGEDLFADNYSNRVIYADGSWQDEKAIYDSAISSLISVSDETYTNEELQRINQDVTNKIRMSNLAISENYFQYLEEGLKQYQKGENNE